MSTSSQNLSVQKWITALSVVLFAGKFVAYYLTNSLAVLSDALESIVNVVAGFIGLYSLYVAAKPKDIEHPYGHGKAEFISAAAEGGLIVASGILIFYETIANIIHQRPLEALDKGVIIIAATAVLNFIAGVICVRIGKVNKSLALQASGSHLKIDTYSTLAILAALAIIYYTHLYWLDKAVALLLALFIIYNGYKIIRSSVAGIMDEADMELLNELVLLLNKKRRENWIDLHNLRVIKYGNILHVDAHLTVPWFLNVNEAHSEVEALQNIIKTEFGDEIEFFVHTDGCLEFSCPICIKPDCDVRQHPFAGRIEWTLKNVLADKKHVLSGQED